MGMRQGSLGKCKTTQFLTPDGVARDNRKVKDGFLTLQVVGCELM